MKLDDKIALKKLRERIDAALAPIATEFGLTKLQTGRIGYDIGGMGAKITVEAKCLGSDGQTQEEADYATYCDMYRLKPEWLHQKMLHHGGMVEIIGLRPNRRRFPVLVQHNDGKKILLTIPEVQRTMGGPSYVVSD